MVSWIVRAVLSLAAIITGWFVVQDASNFDIVQMMVGLLLITVFVLIAAFWSPCAAWLRARPERVERLGHS